MFMNIATTPQNNAFWHSVARLSWNMKSSHPTEDNHKKLTKNNMTILRQRAKLRL